MERDCGNRRLFPARNGGSLLNGRHRIGNRGRRFRSSMSLSPDPIESPRASRIPILTRLWSRSADSSNRRCVRSSAPNHSLRRYVRTTIETWRYRLRLETHAPSLHDRSKVWTRSGTRGRWIVVSLRRWASVASIGAGKLMHFFFLPLSVPPSVSSRRRLRQGGKKERKKRGRDREPAAPFLSAHATRTRAHLACRHLLPRFFDLS